MAKRPVKPELPAAEPAVPTDELLVPPPAEVPPVPSVDAEPEPEPLPAAEPPVPTDELDIPPPADVPPVPSVDAEPEPEPPADEPPVPTEELEVPPPADVPPVPIVELDCARTSAALPARNVAVNAASERRFIRCLPEDFSVPSCECRLGRPVRRQRANRIHCETFRAEPSLAATCSALSRKLKTQFFHATLKTQHLRRTIPRQSSSRNFLNPFSLGLPFLERSWECRV